MYFNYTAFAFSADASHNGVLKGSFFHILLSHIFTFESKIIAPVSLGERHPSNFHKG